MKYLYQIFIELLIIGMKTFSLFNDKTKKAIEGRKKSCDIVRNAFASRDEVIWMHAASLGEYEQGLPVLQSLKNEFPNCKVLVTFFSPSGYENVIGKPNIADALCYLPFDKKLWVKEFTSHFSTKIFFTVKYDYWYNLLEALKSKDVKVYVISALFYETQIFFKPYGKWFVKELRKNITYFFHQTYHSTALAKSIGLKNSETTSDTRFDRVKEIAGRDNFVEHIYEFKGNSKLIIFGSSWESEEKIAQIIASKSKQIKIVLAPHDLARIADFQEIYSKSILYSEISKATLPISEYNVLIIDSIGLLSRIYSYADIAVVGGGFHRAGLHNILEAATFGIPVIFGNKYLKNPEADDLIKSKGAKSFNNEYEASEFLLNLVQEESSKQIISMGESAKHYVHSQPDATKVIMRKITDDFQDKLS